MNFLLHRHLAAAELRSTLAGVGAMLPDLWRMADRRVHPQPSLVGDGKSDALALGVAHHLESDAWFHESAVFTEGEHATAARLREAPFAADRMARFAHVSWELLLDGALVRRDGVDAIVAALRESLDDATTEGARALAERHHFSVRQRTEEEHALFDARMRRIFDELAKGPWVSRYADPKGIAEIVGSIRTRVGLEDLSEADVALLATEIAAMETMATEYLARIERQRRL